MLSLARDAAPAAPGRARPDAWRARAFRCTRGPVAWRARQQEGGSEPLAVLVLHALGLRRPPLPPRTRPRPRDSRPGPARAVAPPQTSCMMIDAPRRLPDRRPIHQLPKVEFGPPVCAGLPGRRDEAPKWALETPIERAFLPLSPIALLRSGAQDPRGPTAGTPGSVREHRRCSRRSAWRSFSSSTYPPPPRRSKFRRSLLGRRQSSPGSRYAQLAPRHGRDAHPAAARLFALDKNSSAPGPKAEATTDGESRAIVCGACRCYVRGVHDYANDSYTRIASGPRRRYDAGRPDRAQGAKKAVQAPQKRGVCTQSRP